MVGAPACVYAPRRPPSVLAGHDGAVYCPGLVGSGEFTGSEPRAGTLGHGVRATGGGPRVVYGAAVVTSGRLLQIDTAQSASDGLGVDHRSYYPAGRAEVFGDSGGAAFCATCAGDVSAA